MTWVHIAQPRYSKIVIELDRTEIIELQRQLVRSRILKPPLEYYVLFYPCSDGTLSLPTLLFYGVSLLSYPASYLEFNHHFSSVMNINVPSERIERTLRILDIAMLLFIREVTLTNET